MIGFSLLVFFLNTLVYFLIFLNFKDSWRESLYAAALLCQLGEFGFILGEIGESVGIIGEDGYQLIISIISVTLIFSPLWIGVVKKIVDFNHLKLRRIGSKKKF